MKLARRRFLHLAAGAAALPGVLRIARAQTYPSRPVAELAERARLPTALQRRENVEMGGLLSYGSNLNEDWRQTALYVDRILKGGKKSADLPVQ